MEALNRLQPSTPSLPAAKELLQAAQAAQTDYAAASGSKVRYFVWYKLGRTGVGLVCTCQRNFGGEQAAGQLRRLVTLLELGAAVDGSRRQESLKGKERTMVGALDQAIATKRKEPCEVGSAKKSKKATKQSII